MDEQTRGFRSAIFGGFNREDVMHYIEETDTKYYTETAELRSRLTEAQSAMNELRTPERGAYREERRAARAAGRMTLDTDKIRAHSFLTRSKAVFPLQAAEIEAHERPCGAACGGKRPADLENAKLSAKCGEYDATREDRAEMEGFLRTGAPSRSRRTPR